jgi:hypothetical protein
MCLLMLTADRIPAAADHRDTKAMDFRQSYQERRRRHRYGGDDHVNAPDGDDALSFLGQRSQSKR